MAKIPTPQIYGFLRPESEIFHMGCPNLSRLGELLNTQKNHTFLPPRGAPGGVPGPPWEGGPRPPRRGALWGPPGP